MTAQLDLFDEGPTSYDGRPIEGFVGFFAVDHAGRAWRVTRAWRDSTGTGWQETAGPDGAPGPLIRTSCAHIGPLAKPPGWRSSSA